MLHQDTCQTRHAEQDLETVLRTLVHDVRSPLGVADGYIRLLRDGKIKASEDQQRALAATLQALQRISELCEFATQCVQPAPQQPLPRIPARLLCERVWAHTGQAPPSSDQDGLAATVCVGVSLDQAVDAVMRILTAPVEVSVSTGGLSLSSTGDGGGGAQSLERLAAERTLMRVGASLDYSAADRRVSVVFPFDGAHV